MARIILILMPFLTAFAIAVVIGTEIISARRDLARAVENSTKTNEENAIYKSAAEIEEKNLSRIQQFNAQLNMFGINYKIEFIGAILIIIGIVISIAIHFLLKAGIFLMLYIVAVTVYSGYLILQGQLEKRKEELTIEFLEKLRDIASNLTANSSFVMALAQTLDTGHISPVLEKELRTVQGDITLGKKMSTAFFEMYERLNIPEIKVFAQTMSVFETQGGDLISVIQSSDRFFSQKQQVRDQQKVIIADMKNSQKFMIGIPLAFVFLLALVNPSFFGDFYSTMLGQIVGIVAITMMMVGVHLSSQLAKI